MSNGYTEPDGPARSAPYPFESLFFEQRPVAPGLSPADHVPPNKPWEFFLLQFFVAPTWPTNSGLAANARFKAIVPAARRKTSYNRRNTGTSRTKSFGYSGPPRAATALPVMG